MKKLYESPILYTRPVGIPREATPSPRCGADPPPIRKGALEHEASARPALCLVSGMAKKTPKRPKVFVHPNALEFFREMGRKGGKKGGKARWEGLSPEERSEIARRAVLARWRKKRS